MSPTMPVSAVGAVNTWDCDRWGHLNVQFYLERLGDAQAAAVTNLGMGPSTLRAAGLRAASVADRIVFRHELRAGSIYRLHSAAGPVTAEGLLTVYTRMVDEEAGRQAAQMASLLRLESGEGAVPRPWPAEIRDRATEQADSAPGTPSQLPHPKHRAPADVDVGRLALTHRTTVESWDCERGWMRTSAQISRVSGADDGLMRKLGMGQAAIESRGWGSAALDFDIRYQRPARVGTAVDIRSGVLAIDARTYHCVHYLVDAATGAVLTTVTMVGALFDLQTRKAVPVPDELRAAAQKLMVGAS